MRNAFVVLVSLYIGLGSGFIVPTGVTEKLSESSILSMMKIKILNKNNTQLERTANKIIEESLFENANEKENNLKERSFILLNQKYKPSLKNQEFGLNMHGWSPRINEDRSFMIREDSARFNDLPYRFSAENIDSSKRVLMSNNKIKETGIPDSVPYVLNKNNPKIINKDYNRPKYEYNENLEERTSYKQWEYLELLKPPLIRPAGDQPKFRNDYKNNNDVHSQNDETYSYEPYVFPEVEPSSDSQYHQKKSNRFGFLKFLPVRNNNIHNNESYDNFPKNSDVHKQIDNNLDERKLFENNNIGYLQEKVTNENVNHVDCNYNGCITKRVGQEVNNYKYTSKLPECSCANQLNLISKDRSATKDRSQREKVKDKTSPPEVNNDFEEMFNEEDDIVNVVNKLSDTLRL